MDKKKLIEAKKVLQHKLKLIENTLDKMEQDRMEELAGVPKEEYFDQLLKKAAIAVNKGEDVTVKGQKVYNVTPSLGIFTTNSGAINMSDLKNPESDILIGGETISLEDPKTFAAKEPSPEEKEKEKREKDLYNRLYATGRNTGY